MNDFKDKIAIYTAQNGQTQIDVKVQDDTVWLTQDMMRILFDTTKQNISLHINNILKEGELSQKATVKDFLTVRKEGVRNISRQITYYNLDMILSVGYRIKSKTATQFRIWANSILKQYLLQGYAVNQQMLAQQKSKLLTLQHTLDLMTRSISNQTKTIEQAKEISDLLSDFVNGLNLLDDFDHKTLDNGGKTKNKSVIIPESEFLSVIDKMKGNFASDVFAKPKDDSFASSVGQIYQTFDNKDLYESLEEKAAMLLYLIVKNHSFVDGNKRIGACCFLHFLNRNNILYNDLKQPIIDDSTLFALTLLVAESKPDEKETVKQVIISVLNRH